MAKDQIAFLDDAGTNRIVFKAMGGGGLSVLFCEDGTNCCDPIDLVETCGCTTPSLVRYQVTLPDNIVEPTEPQKIYWTKCGFDNITGLPLSSTGGHWTHYEDCDGLNSLTFMSDYDDVMMVDTLCSGSTYLANCGYWADFVGQPKIWIIRGWRILTNHAGITGPTQGQGDLVVTAGVDSFEVTFLAEPTPWPWPVIATSAEFAAWTAGASGNSQLEGLGYGAQPSGTLDAPVDCLGTYFLTLSNPLIRNNEGFACPINVNTSGPDQPGTITLVMQP